MATMQGLHWIQDTDGKWYYINIGTYMETNDITPDGYYVDANGVWDGNASTINNKTVNLGPGRFNGWEPVDTGWKFKQETEPTSPIHGSRDQTASGTT